MIEIPRKLRDAPIVEAMFEARFSSQEAPELLVGKLVGNPQWQGYQTNRLATADIPLPVRSSQPNLAFAPTFEIHNAAKVRLIRVGHNILSYHILGPYPGWGVAGQEINQTIDHLFRTVPQLNLRRLGFRYVNLLTESRHFVPSVTELELKCSVRGDTLAPPLTISYRRTHGAKHISQVALATPEYVEGPPGLLGDFTTMVDVDIFTPEGCNIGDLDATKAWAVEAHDILKVEFFRLIPKETLEKLRDDQ